MAVGTLLKWWGDDATEGSLGKSQFENFLGMSRVRISLEKIARRLARFFKVPDQAIPTTQSNQLLSFSVPGAASARPFGRDWFFSDTDSFTAQAYPILDSTLLAGAGRIQPVEPSRARCGILVSRKGANTPRKIDVRVKKR